MTAWLAHPLRTRVDDLLDAITASIEYGNTDPKPFTWHARAEDIIAKVRRGRAT